MKNLIVFFLSLTTMAGYAQYNQNRPSSSKPSLLASYETTRFNKQTPSFVKLDIQEPQTATTNHAGYSLYNAQNVGPATASQHGYFTGSKMTTSGLNGRFQAIQSFDLQGNLRESKATYQFTNRKKR